MTPQINSMDIIKAMTYDMEIQCPNINKQLKT
jgi:hypothetical protein